MRPKTPVLLSIWLIAILAVVACGSGESNANDSSGEVGATESPLVIVFPDQTFTPESFVAAGWKKSKEYDTATVPESSEIWYGFYSQKDIEIRFYETHDAAIEFGVSAAEASIEGAVKRSKGGRLLDVSGGSFTGYAEFLVAGNAILLCEFDRTRCDELVAALE
jgi:hypothetical protein